MRFIIFAVAAAAVLLVIFGYDWIMKTAEKRQASKLDDVKDKVNQVNADNEKLKTIKKQIK